MKTEFNDIGGYLGVLGFILAIIPLTVDKPLEYPLCIGVLVVCGGLFLVLSVAAIVRSWPPAVKPVQDVMGRTLKLEELDAVSPPPLRLGIVGPSYSGKTTLLRGMAALEPSQERTIGVSATVVTIPTIHERTVAVIDGGGQYYSDQFKVAEAADILIIVLDHNQSETEQRLSMERLDEHARFGGQLRQHLKAWPKKRLVLLLANKSDIWQSLEPAAVKAFRNRMAEQYRAWADSNLSDKCLSEEHSNRVVEDMNAVKRILRDNG